MMSRMVLGELGSTINSGRKGGKKNNKFLVMDIFPCMAFNSFASCLPNIKKLASSFSFFF